MFLAAYCDAHVRANCQAPTRSECGTPAVSVGLRVSTSVFALRGHEELLVRG